MLVARNNFSSQGRDGRYPEALKGGGEMRLFIAINFDEEVKNKICDFIEEMKKAGIRGNFTLRENLHLTMVFLGEIPAHKVNAVKNVMDDIGKSSRRGYGENVMCEENGDRNLCGDKLPTISFSGFGNFSDVLWVGIEKDDELNMLQKKLSDGLSGLGFRIEKREFKPHVTVCRRAVLPEGFDRRAMVSAAAKVFGAVRMKVDRIDLMKSERIDGRMVYTPIHTAKL